MHPLVIEKYKYKYENGGEKLYKNKTNNQVDIKVSSVERNDEGLNNSEKLEERL